ncbi:tyrosine-type recombinase/integrase [Faecalicatena contorta]|uniref:tyrosine-type recombinase/integrase n=1 Tax=Faecalicatena contorta TaxID=39482 RepID=UPI0019614967|nr:tyrosine-type recombinase/integrase [Faecalicatena contorta]MBM6686790.1 tyrosine-type recombinase/integrase [Faecalicatena contorta]MBM6709687.1 tyrosine-type recombinase/integrase [Faecalicatena contorta]
MYNPNIKTEIINNIIFTMAEYVDDNTLRILQKVIEEQLVAVNVEEITTLPAEIQTSTEEQNKYYISLMLIKKKNLVKETKKQYRDAIVRLASVIEKPLNKIDEIDIDYYLSWYEKRNVAAGRGKNQASTVNNERRYLSAFFTWMRREKFITFNPVEGTEPLKEIKKPIDYFRPAQIEELREGCRSLRDRAIIEVLRSTGARVGEIPQINRKDLDWETGDILILSEKSGRYRMLYVDEVARFHLKRYLDQRADDNEALFVWEKAPHSRLGKTGIRAAMKEIGKREGMDCKVYPHKMRKTLGMNLKNRGANIGDIQEIMGHANPTVTSRYYAQSTPETLRDVRRRTA